MRLILIALLLGSAAVLTSCEGYVDLTFVNETDSRLCYSTYLPDADETLDCSADVKPQGTTHWAPDCGPPDTAKTTLVLTVSPRGPTIYQSVDATCREWRDSGGKITIRRAGGEFVVTDSLSGDTPSP
jgi:hypothetical protein